MTAPTLRLENKISNVSLIINNLNMLGLAQSHLGNAKGAIDSLEEGLKIARQYHDRSWEGTILGNLGNVYYSLGQIQKTIDLAEKALTISNSGVKNSKQIKSIAYAMSGNAYADLGDDTKALELYKQAVAIDHDVGNRPSEAVGLTNIGYMLLILNEIDQAIESFVKAIEIADAINDIGIRNSARCRLAQAYLMKKDLVLAHKFAADALQFDSPDDNHITSVIIGIVSLHQRNLQYAAKTFNLAVAQANERISKTPAYYMALDSKGLALSGLSLIEEGKHISDSKESFRLARKIISAAGVVKRTLLLFDELAKVDTEGVLTEIRQIVEGRV